MNHEHFARRIPAYFDGTLKESERTELEAYVGTHEDFAAYFRQKEAEQATLKLRIPDFALAADELQRLESEVKEVVQNLFKDDEANLSQRLKSWLKEKI